MNNWLKMKCSLLRGQLSPDFQRKRQEKLLMLIAKAFPDKKPVEIWSMITTTPSENCGTGRC